MKRRLWNKVGHDSCLCCVSLTLILWPYPSCRPSIMNRCCKTQFGMTRGRGGGRAASRRRRVGSQAAGERPTGRKLKSINVFKFPRPPEREVTGKPTKSTQTFSRLSLLLALIRCLKSVKVHNEFKPASTDLVIWRSIRRRVSVSFRLDDYFCSECWCDLFQRHGQVKLDSISHKKTRNSLLRDLFRISAQF